MGVLWTISTNLRDELNHHVELLFTFIITTALIATNREQFSQVLFLMPLLSALVILIPVQELYLANNSTNYSGINHVVRCLQGPQSWTCIINRNKEWVRDALRKYWRVWDIKQSSLSSSSSSFATIKGFIKSKIMYANTWQRVTTKTHKRCANGHSNRCNEMNRVRTGSQSRKCSLN